jgi:hypothetical protein
MKRIAPLDIGTVSVTVNCTGLEFDALVIVMVGIDQLTNVLAWLLTATQSASFAATLAAMSVSIWEDSQMRGCGLSAHALWAARRSGIKQGIVFIRIVASSAEFVGQRQFHPTTQDSAVVL